MAVQQLFLEKYENMFIIEFIDMNVLYLRQQFQLNVCPDESSHVQPRIVCELGFWERK